MQAVFKAICKCKLDSAAVQAGALFLSNIVLPCRREHYGASLIVLPCRREHYFCQIRSKLGPGETKIGSNRSPEGVLGVFGGHQAPQENQADPWEALGESRAVKMGAKEPQDTPKPARIVRKWKQKLGPKTGPKWDQIRSAQKCRFLIDF